MVKLNKKRVEWIIKQVTRESKRPSQIASVYDLSARKVQQLDGKRTTLGDNRK